MRIYLMRHAHAVNRQDPECPADPQRPLVARGREKARQVAHALRLLESRPAILTSPYLRCRQTAELLARDMRLEGIQEEQSLRPEGTVEEVFRMLERFDQEAVLILVGHSPQLEEVLAALLGLNSPFARLKKGAVAALKWFPSSPGQAELRWLAAPALLDKLSRSKS